MTEKMAEAFEKPRENSQSSSTTESTRVGSDTESGPKTHEKAEDFQRNIHGFKWAMTVCAILSCVFLFALDTTVVADIQPNIINALGEFEKFPWLATAFALPSVSFVLVESKIYSLFNIKWLYIIFALLFEIGSAVCGAAPTMNALIVGRMIAGVGGAGMYVGSLTFFSVITSPNERPIYVALVTPVWAVGTVLGPIVGGSFAESAVGWRWGFYINLFIFILAGPIMLFILPSLNFSKHLTLKQKLVKIDWIGLIILVGWSVSFFMALVFGGALYPWDSYSMIILWVVVGVLMIAFVLNHIYHPLVPIEDRLYPGHLLTNGKLWILQFATFAAPAAVYIPIYYIPLFFQFAKGEGPIEAAVKLLPFVFMIAVTSVLNGFFMSKWGYYMPWFLGGGILAVIGGGLMYTVDINTSTSSIFGYSVLLGLGGGCFLLSAFGCVSDIVQPSDVFNAIGVITLLQVLGITFFPAIAGNIFQNVGANYIAPFLPADYSGNPRVILAGSHSPEFQSFSGEQQRQIASAIIQSMSNLYLMTVIACGIVVLISPLLGFRKVAAAASH